MPMRFENTRFDSLLLDIDGTLMHKGQCLPGAAEALAFARSQGLRLQLLTNTTAKMPEALAEELCHAGIQVDPDEIQTATTACLGYLQQHSQLKCHLVVPDSIIAAFSGIATDDSSPDVVVISDIGEAFDYATLNRCFRMLRGGARLIALQKNLFWFDRDGERLDCGAFIVGLEAAARVQALVMGKPSPLFFEAALRRLDTCGSRTLVVGDDVLTDCAGAKAVGASSLLVRTGKYDRALFDAHRQNVDAVIDGIADFPRWWMSINATDHQHQV
ncbi:HAD-super family hydrolase, sub family IIA [Pseudomonas coronafaciens pv. zizaniae]|nr:HAD-super family hydrolase, sub family IIA [Pseudomonas coronafaciens pv. zizaniae]